MNNAISMSNITQSLSGTAMMNTIYGCVRRQCGQVSRDVPIVGSIKPKKNYDLGDMMHRIIEPKVMHCDIP